MIRSIEVIKLLGVFSDFRWPAGLPDFKKYNLIYGWNYSGKTTLSRAFRCFEQGRPHEDFADAQIQLKSEEGGHVLSAPDSAPVIRVFNIDFIHENLVFESGSATPILVLGAEDIANREALKTMKDERDSLIFDKASSEKRRNELKTTIDRALSNYARDFIKNPLSVPNYDKTRFEPRVQECRMNPRDFLLDEQQLAKCLSVYQSLERRPRLSPKTMSLSRIAPLIEKTTLLLSRVVTARRQIPRLQENSRLESWVNQGRRLHMSENTCQFCGQPLPVDLMATLTEHFSADYDNLMSELESLAEEIQAAKDEKIVFGHRADFYPEISDHFVAEKEQLEELLEARESLLSQLEEAITRKRTKAFTQLECPSLSDSTSQIAAAIDTINVMVTAHNMRTDEFESSRQDSFGKLEKHYAALFVQNLDYSERLREISDLEKLISEQSRRIGALDSQIQDLEQELSGSSKGAARINELLSSYFGKNDLRIEVSTDSHYQIKRNDLIAKNLSEGERTAIAFAYFITRVQDGRYPLDRIITVIDDPMSSLDANHVFSTYALIKTQLSGCNQLILLTHSFEFYNLLRDWLMEDERDIRKSQLEWKKWGAFLIKRTGNGESVLEEAPRELLRFKSEYHYLFSKLYHFDRTGTGDFDCLLSLPNVVRRFMEAFGGIMIPLSQGLKEKMKRLFIDEVERERVWKFINHYSHNTTISRSLSIPDTSECLTVVKACLKAVRDWDSEYFRDLETEIM